MIKGAFDTYMDLQFRKEAIPDDVYNLIASQYHNLLGFISTTLGLSGNSVIDLLAGVGEKYKLSNIPIYGMSFNLNDSQYDTMFAKGGQVIRTVHRKIMTAAVRKEKAAQNQEVQLRKRLSEPLAVSGFSRSLMTPTPKYQSLQMSTIDATVCKADQSYVDVLDLAKIRLNELTKDLFLEKFKGAVRDYVKVDSKDIALVKHHSVSCGLHERFYASGERAPSWFSDPKNISTMYERIDASINLKTEDEITDSTVDLVNRAIFDHRTPAEKATLVQAKVNLSGKNPSKYVRNKDSYYRDGRNGRPDFILKNSKGIIVGIVELKQSSKSPSTGNLDVAKKQTAHYQHLFKAKEAFLVYKISSNIKDTVKVHRIEPTIVEFAEQTLNTMLSNIHHLNEALINSSV